MRGMITSRLRVIALVTGLTFGASASAEPQAAQRTDAFGDSIGVNTHFGNAMYPENGYANRQIGAKLAALGVRHVRDHTWNDEGLKIVDALNKKYRIRATLVLGETTRSPAELVKLLKAHPAYEAIEGLNEPDFAKRTYKTFADAKNDYPATRAFQNELYAAVKGDPKTKSIPVLSPAMGRSNRSQFLLPIEFDIAAMHRYSWEGKSALQPSAALDEVIADMAKLRGDRPLWATESGYYNEPAAHARAVPEKVAGKYTPRLLAEFFNRGVARTYLYELADQGTDKAAREQNFGLLRHDMTEKPAYAAVKNLVALLAEPKPKPFTPGSLDFTLTPADERIHHTLLQKGDGRFYLLVWQEVLSYDGVAKREIDNPPVSVTLTLTEPLDARTYLPDESTKPTATQPGVKSLNLSVPDHVLVVELSPAGG
jgi:broad specificity phosphatase PhoE